MRRARNIILWCELLLAILLLICGYYTQSTFTMLCALCTVVYWLILLWLSLLEHKATPQQEKQCRSISFSLLIPSLMLAAAGASVPFVSSVGVSSTLAFGSIGLAALLFCCLLTHVFILERTNAIPTLFSTAVVCSAFSTPLSVLIVLLLQITKSESADMLGCLSTCVFAGIAALIACWLCLIALCGYQSTRESIRMIRNTTKKHKLVFVHASIIKDVAMVLGKSVLSILSFSVFMFVNALYSAGIGLARFIAVKMHKQDTLTQVKSYRTVGIILALSSICYVLYSVRLLFGGKTASYSMVLALAIALYTFVEFGINVREMIRLRKSHALEAKALRAISMASTTLCFVLTQTAILSFAESSDQSIANALSGILFGTLAVLLGFFVMYDSRRYRHSIENKEPILFD